MDMSPEQQTSNVRSPQVVRKKFHGSGAAHRFHSFGFGRQAAPGDRTQSPSRGSLEAPVEIRPSRALSFLLFHSISLAAPGGCNLICPPPSVIASICLADRQSSFRVSPFLDRAPPDFLLPGIGAYISACGQFLSPIIACVVEQLVGRFSACGHCTLQFSAGVQGLFRLSACEERGYKRSRLQSAKLWAAAMNPGDGVNMGPQGPPGASSSGDGGAMAEQVDRLVRQRLEQAFDGVFGRLLRTTEKAAAAAEAQASIVKSDNLVKALKVEAWKPATREEELKTWKEWYFQFSTWVIANDPKYEDELSSIDVNDPVDHDLLEDESVARSQKLYGVLCSLVKGRPLLLIKNLESSRSGFEAIRLLKQEMELREKARSLALMRQLASWQFSTTGGLHEQLVKYEEALRTYEASSGKSFPEDLVMATVVTGLKEPLKSQVQLRMGSSTKYSDVREWILQYESLNAPWSSSLSVRAPGGDGPQPMEVDQVKAKDKDKGKAKDKGKRSKGKPKGKDKGKSKTKNVDGKGWSWPGSGKGWGSQSWSGNFGKNAGGKTKGKKNNDSACHLCGQAGHWQPRTEPLAP